MEYRISNEKISVRVDSKGAQLMSLYHLERRKEYLWQGDPVGWGDRALLLFPACSRIADNRILVRGQEYFMPTQGFGKKLEFKALEHTTGKLVLEAAANDYTLAMFPYLFRLRVAFTLEGERVHEEFTVFNDSYDEMSFSIGSHPGFFCPIDLNEKVEDYVLEFDRPQNILKIDTMNVSKLLLHTSSPFIVGTELPLHSAFFADGPKLLENLDADWIRLKSKKSGKFVQMEIKGFDHMALWGLNERMTFICLEPWVGTSDYVDSDHVWETKPCNAHVEPMGMFKRELVFSFN